MADKTKSGTIILAMILLVVAGCHKPSTRLQAQINFCENVVLDLHPPGDLSLLPADDADVENMVSAATDLKLKLSKNSREYQVFGSVLDEYDSYETMIKTDRYWIDYYRKAYKAEVQDHGSGSASDALAANLKNATVEDNAQVLQEYQFVKDKAKEAEEILEKIQANE
jgi:hypothetical protein